jgi:hypothetical protein
VGLVAAEIVDAVAVLEQHAEGLVAHEDAHADPPRADGSAPDGIHGVRIQRGRKSEIRISKSETNSNIEIRKQEAGLRLVWDIGISNLFRISIFEFRI